MVGSGFWLLGSSFWDRPPTASGRSCFAYSWCGDTESPNCGFWLLVIGSSYSAGSTSHQSPVTSDPLCVTLRACGWRVLGGWPASLGFLPSPCLFYWFIFEPARRITTRGT